MSLPLAIVLYTIAGAIGLWQALEQDATMIHFKCICGEDLFLAKKTLIKCPKCDATYRIKPTGKNKAEIQLLGNKGDALYECTCKRKFIIPHGFLGIISCPACGRSYLASNKSELKIEPVRKRGKWWKNQGNMRLELMKALLHINQTGGKNT